VTQDIISVNISSNPPPYLVTALPNVTVEAGMTETGVFDLDDYFADPESEQLLMSAHGSYRHISISIHEDHGVDFTAGRNWFGVEEVIFRATDPNGGIAEDQILVYVIGEFLPPEILELPTLYVPYNETWKFDVSPYIRDPDTPLQELLLSTDDGTNITVDGLTLQFHYSTWMGEEYSLWIEIRVSDGPNEASRMVQVILKSGNPPKLVDELPDIFFYEDTTYISTFTIFDHFENMGSDPLFEIVGTENVTVEILQDGRLSLSATPNWYGTELLSLRVTNDDLLSVEDPFLVTVLPVNDPPVILPVPIQKVREGEVYLLDIRPYIIDVDDALERLEIWVNGTHVTVVGHILLLRYPSGADEDTVTLEVSDGKDNATSEFIVEVLPSGAPAPPVLALLWPWVPLLGALAIVGLFLYYSMFRTYALEDLFLVGKEGRLIAHNTTRIRADRDEDILAGMLTAIQEFVKDAFREENEDLKRFEFGDKTVLIERGAWTYLAAFYKGKEPPHASESLRAFMEDVEERYKTELESWTGEPEILKGLNDMMNSFATRRVYRRGDWKRS